MALTFVPREPPISHNSGQAYQRALTATFQTSPYTLILRKKSDSCVIRIRVIQKRTRTHSFIEVLLLKRPYYACGIFGQLFAYQSEELFPFDECGQIFVLRQQYNGVLVS